MSLTYDRYLGPFTGAPAELRARLDRLPALALLRATEWERGCYVPKRKAEFDTDLAVLFRPFRWDDRSPWEWLACTVGLSAVEQPVAAPTGIARLKSILAGRRNGPSFRRFELCASFTEPEGWDEFHEAWDEGRLGEYGLPPVFEHFALIAHDFASWMTREREAFELGDPVLNAALVSPFSSALLVPPVPELLLSGVAPWKSGRHGAIELGRVPAERWKDRAVLGSAGEGGFMQLAPLMREEFDAARNGLGWEFFLEALLPTPDEAERGLRPASIISDLVRPSRRPLFDAQHP